MSKIRTATNPGAGKEARPSQSAHYHDLCACLHVGVCVRAQPGTAAFTFCSSSEPEYLTLRSLSWTEKTIAHCCTLYRKNKQNQGSQAHAETTDLT